MTTPQTQSGVRRLRAALAAAFDIEDAFFFGGLFLAGVGGVMLSLPWTLIAIGAVLALKGHATVVARRGEP